MNEPIRPKTKEEIRATCEHYVTEVIAHIDAVKCIDCDKIISGMEHHRDGRRTITILGDVA